jgi:dTDP-4-dehydrorhamnose 3,5-epimerase
VWNDPAIGIEWPALGMAPLLADRDATADPLASADLF